MAAWRQHPDMHVYHFTSYEPGALKRLMGRYATHEDEIDRLLRAGILVDLHSITRQSVRASVEQYSLKQLEPFYGYTRIIPLEQARTAMRLVEHTLELSRNNEIDYVTRQAIEVYNRDDCASTKSLRDWLETQRDTIIAAGREVPRPTLGDGAASEALDEQQARITALVTALTADIPADENLRTPEQAARWLLANILDYHRREGKANWWEYFRLRDLPDDDLYDEGSGIADLVHAGRQFEGRSKLPYGHLHVPEQEIDVRADDELHHGGQKVGTVTAIDPVRRQVSIKKTGNTADAHPPSVYAHRAVRTNELADSLSRRPAPGKWSVRAILAHMAEDELVSSWRYRQMIENSGATLPDSIRTSGQDSATTNHGQPAQRSRCSACCEGPICACSPGSLPEEWQRYGIHAERGRMTVADLARQMAGHDVNHINQVRRSLYQT